MTVTKQDVYEFIKESGPVKAEEILEVFDGLCSECGQELERASTINEYWIQLLDEKKIITDARWRYMVRDT